MKHFYEDVYGFSQNDIFALYKKWLIGLVQALIL